MKFTRLKQFWFWILPLLKNKYTLTLIVFLGWIAFFDQNNLVDRVQNLNQYHQLEKDKMYYIQKIKDDSTKLHELETDRNNLEKFAREQYLMKKKNEDIFIIAD
ncbi:MAG: septum formation initiator family protein [Bacteroidota bacterium]|nr:septum formation initiator family protein [Bacteroidota bacterium]